MKTIASMIALSIALTACLGSDFQDSVEGSWQLTSGTVDGEEIPLVESHPITITFEGEQVSGTASCNTYQGSFELSGTSLSIEQLAMTEMACSPQEVMEAETMYAEALTRLDGVALDEGLVLTGPEVELRFERAEATG